MNLKILYVGPIFPGSTARYRMESLTELGGEVRTIDTSLPFKYGAKKPEWEYYARGTLRKLNQWIDWQGIERSILSNSKGENWDILWVDKGIFLHPKTLLRFKESQPKCVLVNYSPDDMFNPANQTRQYRDSFPIYDLFVTTKSFNVPEFLKAGANDVIFVEKAYDPSTHRPMTLTEDERACWGCDICFVGGREKEREQSIEYLAKQGFSIGLFGDWMKIANKYKNVTCHPGYFTDDAYAKALCSGKIGLGFLRKANRDLQTARSIELPACGAFMLAERTNEHLSLFQEGTEAEFFGSNEELAEKARYYLEHPHLREKIANAGRERCLRSGYSNAERLRAVLEKIKQVGACK